MHWALGNHFSFKQQPNPRGLQDVWGEAGMAQEGTKAYEQAVKEGDTSVLSDQSWPAPKDVVSGGLSYQTHMISNYGQCQTWIVCTSLEDDKFYPSAVTSIWRAWLMDDGQNCDLFG